MAGKKTKQDVNEKPKQKKEKKRLGKATITSNGARLKKK